MKYLIGLCAFTLALQASPEGGQVVHGEAAWHQDGSQLHIATGDKAIIDWSHFSIKEGEAVHFIQSGRDSAVLNRDIGGLRSDILGTLTGAGKVYLINKSGIFIGKDAVIDTGSFIGSTFDVLNEDFIRGGELLFTEGDGAIVNQGKITAEGGELILISRDITQEGVLKGQDVHLIEGCEVLYKPHGTDRVYARGTSYQSAIRAGGTIEALGVENRGGKIFLVADKVEVSGDLIANSGLVRVEGANVEVHGTIDASAITGDGGKVFVIGDESVLVDGSVKARGGALGGDGGFIEFSAPKVDWPAAPDASAPLGKPGTFLLDPFNVALANANPGGIYSWVSTLPLGNLIITLNSGTSVTINTTNTGTILYDAVGPAVPTGLISVQNPVVWNSNAALTLDASTGGSIFVGANIENDSASVSGSITLTAEDSIVIGSIDGIAPATGPAIVGSAGGGVTATATTGSITIGLAGGTFPCQLGYGFTTTPTVVAGISATANTNIILNAGAGANSYAQIGHGTQGSSFSGLQGPITVTSLTGNVTLNPGSNVLGNEYAMIGHGGQGITNAATTNISGTISLMVSQAITMNNGSVGTNNFAQIGHGGAGTIQTASLGTELWTGDITLNAGGALSMLAGAGTGCYTQIGHGGDQSQPMNMTESANGINITANSLTMETGVGGAGTEAYCQIGHGGTSSIIGGGLTVAATGTISSDVIVTTTNPINLSGGVSISNTTLSPSQIGHGGMNLTYGANLTSLNVGTLTQKIFVTGSSVTMNAGSSTSATGGGAFIGHGPFTNPTVPATVDGDVHVTTNNGNLTMTGGTAGTGIISFIGNGIGSIFVNVYNGNQNIMTNGGGISLTGSAGISSAAVIDLLAPTGTQNVQSNGAGLAGTISLTGGTNTGAVADIISSGIQTVQTTVAGANITLQGGNNTNTGAMIKASGNTQQVTATGGIALTGGFGMTSPVQIHSTGAVSQTVQSLLGSINLIGGEGLNSHAFISCNCPTQIVQAHTNILAEGGPSFTSFAYAQVQNSDIAGSMKIISDTGNVFFRASGQAYNPAAINLFPVPGGSSIEIDAFGDITLSSNIQVDPNILINADSTSTGQGSFIVDTTGYSSKGNFPPINGITIKGDNNITIHSNGVSAVSTGSKIIDFVVGALLDISGGPLSTYLPTPGAHVLPAAFSTNSGLIFVSNYRDIWFISSEATTGAASVSAPKGSTTFIANRDMHLTTSLNPALISVGIDATLVVDNAFPTSPLFGPGRFLMDPLPVTVANIHIKVFTSRQPLNSTGETLGGLVFTPGTQYVNTNHEQWGDYYNNPFFGGPDFTIFYKDKAFTPTPPGGPTLPPAGAAIYQAQTGMSQMFFDLRDYDDKMYFMKFYISYDRDKYFAHNSVKKEMTKVISYLDNYQKAYYWKWLFRGMPAIKSVSSYEVDRNEEYMLPPRWKGFIE